MWPWNSNWKRLLVILAPLCPENTNILSLHTATGKLQQDGGISPLWSIWWTQRQTWTMTKSFWVFNFKCCSLLLWKWMKHASSQHACSRSCRLMVHMSFNLYVGEIVTKVMHKNKYICRKWNKKFIHTWHFHHNRQISRVYHCRLWPHVQIWPLASWNRDAGFLGLVSQTTLKYSPRLNFYLPLYLKGPCKDLKQL